MRNFRKYKVWNESIELVTNIYEMVGKFPTFETYGLSDQLRRAVISIASNVAEGSSRISEKEFGHFLQISLGSAFEVETQLIVAQKLKYISESELKTLLSKIDSIEKQLNQMISMLN